MISHIYICIIIILSNVNNYKIIIEVILLIKKIPLYIYITECMYANIISIIIIYYVYRQNKKTVL